MKAPITRGVAAATALVAITAAIVVGSGGIGSAAPPTLQAYAITSGLSPQLMAAFKTDTPQVNDWVQVVNGLTGDTFLIGIDFRVQDGRLYGVGNGGGVYTIAIPAQAGQPVLATKVSQLVFRLANRFTVV